MLRDRLSGWFRRLLARLRHRRFDRELREELAAHEAMVREALEASGVPTDEARTRARKQLGSVARAREDSRAVWVPMLVDGMRADLRYAARGLARYPAYTVTAVLTLVVAIGLNSSLFTVFNGVYLRPWPVEDARSLFTLTLVPRAGELDKGMPGIEGLPYGDFVAVRDRAMRSTLAAFGGRIGSISVRAGSTAGIASVLPVSRDFFAVARPPLLMGRGLTAADAESQAAVISHRFWTTHFGGDPAILGRSLFVEGEPTTIVGVLGPAFAGIPPRSVDVYVPLPSSTPWSPAWRTAFGNYDGNPARSYVRVIGRPARGWSWDEAAIELTALHGQISTDSRRAGRDVLLAGTAHGQRPGAVPPGTTTVFQWLFAGGVLVLLLACANVGNLQLARGLARRREIATRLALGAGRGRVVRQLLTESLLLSLLAGGGAIGIAWLLPNAVMGFIEPMPTALQLTPDVVVLTFSLGICLSATVAFGLTPALQITRGRPIATHLEGRGFSVPVRRLRTMILAVQVAVSTVLIVGALLLARGLYVHVVRDLAFTDGVLVANVDSSRGGRIGQERTRAVVEALEHATSLDLAYSLPRVLAGGYRTEELRIRNGDPPVDVVYFAVSPNFFRVLEIPLVRGRTFASAVEREVIVNETLAGRLAPDGQALGRMLTGTSGAYRVIGVVADRRLLGGDIPRPLFFVPYMPGDIQPDILIRDDKPDARAMVSSIVASVDSDLSVRVVPLRDRIGARIRGSLIGTSLAAALGVVALGLATVGVFGVFGYLVEERRREIGIRLALGGARARVVLALLATTRSALGGGLVVGVLIAIGVGSTMRRFLYGLDPIDPLSYAIAGGILATAALVATAIPARRAATVDPALTLRSE